MSEYAWIPPERWVEDAHATALARSLGVAGYHELLALSTAEPERFWDAVARDLGPGEHSDEGAEADDARRVPVHEAGAVLAVGADRHHGNDGRQRGRLGGELREPEAERERRHEDDPPADSEEAGEHPACETQRQRERDVAHQASLPATTSITHANASCRCGPRTRLASVVPSTTPATAGRPISRASRHTTRSSKA